MRRKGKVHPSPPPSSSSSSSASSSSSVSSPHPSTNKDALSFLKLLPAAILAIVSILSHEDRQVLAYMISRSIKATNPSSDFIQEISKKKKSKKLASPINSSTAHSHKPSFYCECFDCYTSYWFRWDSSPNRELIHQAIEAFEEEHLYNGEQSKKGKNKKKYKMGRRGIGKMSEFVAGNQSPTPAFQELAFLEKVSSETAIPQSKSAEMVSESRKSVELLKTVILNKDVNKKTESPEHEVVVLRGVCGGANNDKGFARKVLPDVLGLFNSRLWSLWGPNV